MPKHSPILGTIVFILAQLGLDVSGFTSLPLAVVLWGLALLCAFIWAWRWVPEIRHRSRIGWALVVVGLLGSFAAYPIAESLSSQPGPYLNPDLSGTSGVYKLFAVNNTDEPINNLKYNISLREAHGNPNDPRYHINGYQRPFQLGVGSHPTSHAVPPGRYLVELTTPKNHYRQYLSISVLNGVTTADICLWDDTEGKNLIEIGNCPSEFLD